MSRFLTFRNVLFGGFIAMTGVAVGSTVKPVLAHSTNSSSSPPAFSNEDLKADEQIGQQLNDELADLLARKAAKRVIAADLASQRLTLAQAAEAFLEIDTHPTDRMLYIRRGVPGDTDLEREARSAILYSLSTIASAENQKTLRQHLEAEFTGLKDSTGLQSNGRKD